MRASVQRTLGKRCGVAQATTRLDRDYVRWQTEQDGGSA